MIEILWHGRGGQGAFTAARLGKKRMYHHVRAACFLHQDFSASH